jgi:hypothetical protein
MCTLERRGNQASVIEVKSRSDHALTHHRGQEDAP